MSQIAFGFFDHLERRQEPLELFATKVMPAFV